MTRDCMWITRDGHAIPIKDMTLKHIKSSIVLIIEHDWRKHYLPVLKAELKLRNTKLFKAIK